MSRKRLLWAVLLVAVCSMGWYGYRAARRSMLNHDLILASATGDAVTVRDLLDQGANPNTIESSTQRTGWEHFLDLLLHHPQSSSLVCPLSQALAAGNVEIVRLLLEHHADPNIKLPGSTPLPLRAVTMAQDDRMLALLLQYGADPNTIDQEGASQSCMLMYAINAQRWSLVQLLLDHGARPDLANAQGDTALLWAAYQQDPKVLQLLLAHGADVNHKNNRGQTALTYALAHKGPLQNAILESLLAAGADVNAQDLQNCSPFLLALTIRSSSVEMMLVYGGDVRRAIPSPVPTDSLYVTMRLEHASTLVNIVTTVSPGTTPLMFAVRAHNTALVRKMLAKGADVAARDAKGKTALDYSSDDPEIRAALQHAGAHL